MKHILTLALMFALLATASSALAVTASIKQRTPFCREAKEGCQPVFFLTPADGIQIEGQTGDSKWLRVKHLASGQSGWVKAEFVAIAAPSRLEPETVIKLDAPALALIDTPEGPALLDKLKLQPLPIGDSLELKGLESLQSENLRGHLSTARELKIYGLAEVEKQKFIQEVQPALKPYPRYRSLLRLDDGPYSVVSLPDEVLLVLGKGSAAWGQSLLVGLDAQYLPVMLLRNAAEILAYVPEEARQGLRGESLRLWDLDADGTLVASAYHAGARRDVLLRVRPRINAAWEYEGLVYWPKELPFRPDAPSLKLRLWSSGEQSVLVTSISSGENPAGYLAFFAGGNESLTMQKLQQPILDGQLWQGEFWSLQSDSVTRWKPVMDEKKEQ